MVAGVATREPGGGCAMRDERGAAARVAAWLVYPAVLCMGIGLQRFLVAAGLPAPASSYAAVALGAGLVVLLEAALPHAAHWRSERADRETDLLYMVAVQMALPPLLAVTLSVALLRALGALGLEVSPLWPHAAPIALQVVLMLLVADFLRYWLHVAAHRWSPLWRLHAVHHSPPRSSTGSTWAASIRWRRLSSTCSTLCRSCCWECPSRSSPSTSSSTRVNGFFQHSNVEVRLGLLNYVISRRRAAPLASLSPIPSESNNNYGNNFIVWDVLFGTRFLPADRDSSGELGLPKRRVSAAARRRPAQGTPFIRQLENDQREPVPTELASGSLVKLDRCVGRMAGAAVRTAWRPAGARRAKRSAWRPARPCAAGSACVRTNRGFAVRPPTRLR